MANKFFYNRVYNLAKRVLNITFVISLIAGLIIAFSIVTDSNLIDTRIKYGIKNTVTIQPGSELQKRMFFDYDKEELSEKAEVIYPYNMDLNKVGKYNVSIMVDGKTYISQLIVADI